MSISSPSIEHQWRKLGSQLQPEQAAAAAAIEPDGYDEGFARGLEDAKVQFENEQRAAKLELVNLSNALQEATIQAQTQAREDVVRLVGMLFAALLPKQLFSSEETFSKAVNVLQQNLEEEGDFTIHLHPTDCEILKSSLGDSSAYTLVSDAAIARGSIRLQDQFVITELNTLAHVAELLSGLETDGLKIDE